MSSGEVAVRLAPAGVGVPVGARAAAAGNPVMRPGGHGQLGHDLVAHGLFVVFSPRRLWTRRDGLERVSRNWLGSGGLGGAWDPEFAGGGAAIERLVNLALGNATAS